MMWSWLTKMFGKAERRKRKKVLVDIPYEQHRFNMEHFTRNRVQRDGDDGLATNTPEQQSNLIDPNPTDNVIVKDIANKST